jgi:transposase
MSEVTTIGIDLAKNVFQVHGVDAGGMVLVRKAIRRAPVLSFQGSAAVACRYGGMPDVALLGARDCGAGP